MAVPYTKSLAQFQRMRDQAIRVPYWFDPKEMSFCFDWPRELNSCMPRTISIRQITTNPEDVQHPQFGNPAHIDIARHIARQLEVVAGRAATHLGFGVDMAPQARPPTFKLVEQMELL